MKEILLVFVSLGAGGIGFLVVNFWMKPILSYISLRRTIVADLVFYANVISADNVCDELKQKHEERRERNRRHASELAACIHDLPGWYRWLLGKREEKPEVASKHLVGLSNCSSYESADIHVQWIKKALCLSPDLDV